jgi:hypothetical protein
VIIQFVRYAIKAFDDVIEALGKVGIGNPTGNYSHADGDQDRHHQRKRILPEDRLHGSIMAQDHRVDTHDAVTLFHGTWRGLSRITGWTIRGNWRAGNSARWDRRFRASTRARFLHGFRSPSAPFLAAV